MAVEYSTQARSWTNIADFGVTGIGGRKRRVTAHLIKSKRPWRAVWLGLAWLQTGELHRTRLKPHLSRRPGTARNGVLVCSSGEVDEVVGCHIQVASTWRCPIVRHCGGGAFWMGSAHLRHHRDLETSVYAAHLSPCRYPLRRKSHIFHVYSYSSCGTRLRVSVRRINARNSGIDTTPTMVLEPTSTSTRGRKT